MNEYKVNNCFTINNSFLKYFMLMCVTLHMYRARHASTYFVCNWDTPAALTKAHYVIQWA